MNPRPSHRPEEVASRLRLATTRLGRVLRRQAETDLTPTKLAHLATINREGPMSLGDLACCERVSAPTVTKVVKELEGLGLVVREAAETDKRVSLVSVTSQGKDTIEASRTRKDAWLTEQLALLPSAELALLGDAVSILEKLTEAD